MLELLAPAKTAEIGREAVLHGADAVYIGGPAFGARHNATNTVAEIARLVEFAHPYHVRIYATLNTILHDAELEAARRLVYALYDAGVDALIVQDMGLLELDLPPIALHASTQCDIRTPAKARFLADAGFSQLILARELSLREIQAVQKAVADTGTLLEHFVHGALCVAYSGQCYISHAQTGRSANRGDCSQACRLPYTLKDEAGRVVAWDKHLLSLKDNHQGEHLLPLIEAGIRSFKIEGRYKDSPYVKNITACYRRLLDDILTRRTDLVPASSGRCTTTFTPDPDKTFHRGSTDYFTQGRREDIGAFDSPAFVGLPLGEVCATRHDSLDLLCGSELCLNNGDGLNYSHKRTVTGFQADVVKLLGPDPDGQMRWRIFPREPVSALPGLGPGTQVYRNRDHAWEQALLKPSGERRIPVKMTLETTPEGGLLLRVHDEEGHVGQGQLATSPQPAKDREQAISRLRDGLARLGQSLFVLASPESDITIALPTVPFVPASQINTLRREALEDLTRQRAKNWPRSARQPETQPPPVYPESALTYLANIYNHKAAAFYRRHGVELLEMAYEAHQESGECSLMITRHCLRYAFQLCPKQAKGIEGVKGQIRAEPMTLMNGKEKLILRFDCRACEMHVIGKIRPGILKSPPPGSSPVNA